MTANRCSRLLVSGELQRRRRKGETNTVTICGRSTVSPPIALKAGHDSRNELTTRRARSEGWTDCFEAGSRLK